MFIDRIEEMNTLRMQYKSDAASFVVIYGRRRTGKTTLISEFQKEVGGLYFLATEESEGQNLRLFRQEAADFLHNNLLGMSEVGWEMVFRQLADAAKEKRIVIAIDEFQYIARSNSAFISVMQRIWDTILKDSNVMLILCGSLVNSMKKQVLDYDSPLYGRRTAQIRLKQIPFAYYKEFNTELSKKELIEKYAVTGGIPKYIESFGNESNIYDGILNHVINTQSYLYEEPLFLLQNEVSEIGSYFSLIKAIAMNNHKLSEISSYLQIPQTGLTKYIKNLIELDVITRVVPATELNPEKSKSGLYFLNDNYLEFWFKFVYPYRSLIERGDKEYVLSKIKEGFVQNHVSYVYERISREELKTMASAGAWSFIPSIVGAYWGSECGETDIVAYTPREDNLIIGECKYTESEKGLGVLHKLEEKSKTLLRLTNTKNVYYIIFSTAGFTEALKAEVSGRADIILTE